MDDIGVARVRNDGLEEAEARLNMFKMPHRLPVGRERERMHPQEFYRRAGPAVADAKQQEYDVMNIIEKRAENPHGGARMASVAFNQQPRPHVARSTFGQAPYTAADDYGVARQTSVSGHEHKDTFDHFERGMSIRASPDEPRLMFAKSCRHDGAHVPHIRQRGYRGPAAPGHN